LILTPARHSDIQARVKLISDPSVDPWLWSPMRPYTTADALERFHQLRSSEQRMFDEWAALAVAAAAAADDDDCAASGPGSPPTSVSCSGFPLGAIRCRNDVDGTDVLLGEMGVRREDHYVDVVDEAERQQAVERNLARPIGDPEILWTWFCTSPPQRMLFLALLSLLSLPLFAVARSTSTVAPLRETHAEPVLSIFLRLLPSPRHAVVLGPEAAGKGLMTSLLRDVVHQWLVPVLNVHEMVSFAFCGNAGSRRVHLKVGFEQVGTEWIRMPEHRGGQMREEWVFRWSRSKQTTESLSSSS
jgi:RimJ/RimL family protein N-acetyltransferase